MLRRIQIVALCFALSSSLLAQKKYDLEKLGPSVNTPEFDEVSPVVSLDGKKLFYTRLGYYDFDRTLIEDGEDLSYKYTAQKYENYIGGIYSTIAGRTVRQPFTSSYNQDIWIAKSDEDYNFNNSYHPSYPLNNALPNSVGSLTPAGNEVILINQFVADGGMKKGFSISRENSDGTWSFPEDIVINNYHNSGPDVSMCMSSDGSVLIISLEKRDGKGKSDLYLSLRQDNDNWTTPINLGNHINTSARETTPFLSEDKRLLFFSSNRNGNNDIYMVQRKGDDWFTWSRPMLYKFPINSKADDSRPYFNAETGYLYFTSKRDGSSDIFRAKIAKPNPYFVTLSGRIIDSHTKEPVSAKILSNYVGTNFDNFYVSTDGTYKMKVPKGVSVNLTTQKDGYEGRIEEISFPSKYVFFKEVELDLYVDPLRAGSRIALDPIFFEQSKATVRNESYAALDKLSLFLNDNKNIRIKVSGHTDNQGPPESLLKLSKERSEAIKSYLVQKKFIHPLRIKTEGMGSSEPIADNRTDSGRKKNRRVEITISEVVGSSTAKFDEDNK